MSPGGGHLQGPLHQLLPHDLGKVGARQALLLRLPGRGRGDGPFPPQVGQKLTQIRHRIHGQIPGQGGLGGVLLRHVQLPHPRPGGGHGHGQGPGHRPQGPGQGQLPQKGGGLRRRRNVPLGGQDAQENGEIVEGPLLAQGGGGQVDGDAGHGEPGPAGPDRGPHPLPGLLHRRVGQAHHVKGGQAPGQGALRRHRISGDALEAQGRDCHNHGLALLPLPKRIFSHYTTKIRAAHLRKSPKKAPLFEPIGEKEKIPPIGANIAFTAGKFRAIVVDV